MRQFVVLILVLVLLGGCVSQTPRANLLMATTGYASAVESLTTAYDAGLIDDGQAAKIEPYRQIARAALDSYRASVMLGQPDDNAWRQFRQALEAMLIEGSAK